MRPDGPVRAVWRIIAEGRLASAPVHGWNLNAVLLEGREPPWRWVAIPQRPGWRGRQPEGAAATLEQAMADAEAAAAEVPLA